MRNPDATKFSTIKDLNTEMRLVYHFLSYIKMSPSTVEEHKNTYVISKHRKPIPDILNHLRSSHEVIINENIAILEQIFKFWLNKADDSSKFDECEIWDVTAVEEASIFFLVGAAGVGKTALLNYLFSVNYDTLIKKSIFWVRVDLNDYSQLDQSLKERLMSKVVKIFSRYYLYEEKLGFDKRTISELKEYLINHFYEVESANHRNFYCDQFIRLIEELHRKYRQQQVLDRKPGSKNRSVDCISIAESKFSIHSEIFITLCELLVTFMQDEKGYKFISMIDGMDSVTLDSIQYERYKMWIDEVFDLFSDNLGNKGIFIISMRDLSHIDFRISHQNKISKQSHRFVSLRVEPFSFYSIFRQRFDYIVKIAEERGLDIDRTKLFNLRNNLIDILNIHLYNTTAKIFDRQFIKNKNSTRESYDQTSALTNQNSRATMRLYRNLILLLDSILGDDSFSILSSSPGYFNCLRHIERKSWAIYRLLLFGNYGRSLYKNRVGYDKTNGKAKIQTKAVPVIPNVFNYKIIYQAGQETGFPRNLLKLRIINLISSDGLDTCNTLDLEKIMVELYSCDNSLIYDDIMEMVYSGLLYTDYEDPIDFAKTRDNNMHFNVTLSRLSKYGIDRILSESIYYEIICDDTPIDRRVASDMNPVNRFESKNSYYTGLGEYIKDKTKNILYFINYLVQLEQEELLIIQKKKINIEVHEIFTDTRLKMLKKKIRQYLFRYLQGLKEVTAVAYKNNWESYFRDLQL